MINRRDMIKSLLYGVTLLPFIDATSAIGGVGQLKDIGARNDPDHRAIFCMIDDLDLENELEKCAREIGCEIMFDWHYSPELLFEHHNVAVVDGSIIDKAVWDMNVELSNDGSIKVPCIMVGNAENLKMPKFGKGKVIRFDRNALNSPKEVAYAVRKIMKRENPPEADPVP